MNRSTSPPFGSQVPGFHDGIEEHGMQPGILVSDTQPCLEEEWTTFIRDKDQKLEEN